VAFRIAPARTDELTLTGFAANLPALFLLPTLIGL
jgi:hypothetical protein